MTVKSRILLVASLALLASASFLQDQSKACSRALYVSVDQKYLLVGRNMDWPGDIRTNLWVTPRGAAGNGLAASNPLRWQAKYGSVVATAYDAVATDGMNEKGLVANLLWLTEADFGPRDDTRPGLCVSLWLQFSLDNFATVDEAVKFFETSNLQILPAMCPDQVHEPVAVHLALADRTGDSAVLEYVAGQFHVYRGKDAVVTTNSPTQDKQLEHLKEFKGFGGTQPLPGDSEPENRFVRAAYYVDQLAEPQNNRQAVAEMLSVMRNVAQPFGRVQRGEPYATATLWTTVADISDDTYYFQSTTSPSIIWVDLAKIDFSLAQCLDLAQFPDRAGNLTSDFQPAALFTPIPPMAP